MSSTTISVLSNTITHLDLAMTQVPASRTTAIMGKTWRNARKPRHMLTCVPRRRRADGIFGLPPELLAGIFLQCEANEAKYVHTLVCKLWHDIVVNIPQLWEEFHFRFSGRGGVTLRCLMARAVGHEMRAAEDRDPWVPPYQKSAPLTTRARLDPTRIFPAWIDRAKSRPLTLIFDFEPTGINFISSPSPCRIFAKLLKPYSGHLRSLDISMPLRLYQTFGLLTESVEFPALHRIALTITHDAEAHRHDNGFAPKSRSISFAKAPLLSIVFLETTNLTFHFLSSSFISDFPYSQLTTLSIIEPGLHPAQALSVLARCTKLVHCTLSISGWAPLPSPITANRPALILPNLRVLDVTFIGRYSGARIIPFFDHLTLPRLRKLYVRAPNASDGGLILAFHDMIRRSDAVLHTLCLVGVGNNVDVLLGLLERLPSLEVLILEAPRNKTFVSIPSILRQIAYQHPHGGRADGFTMLPKLVEIDLTDNIPNEFEEDAPEVLGDIENLKAIKSRCWSDEDETEDAWNKDGDDAPGRLRRLEMATIRWRNVPRAWCDKKKRRLTDGYIRALSVRFGVDIFMPLEPRA